MHGLWEAAETYLEKLLQQGEPVETVAPDLITALLNAHESPLESEVKRIERLLQELEQAGHANLAAPLRQQHQAHSRTPARSGGSFGDPVLYDLLLQKEPAAETPLNSHSPGMA